MDAPLRAELDRLLGSRPPRAGSLAITVFCDCISQQGESVWLASLVQLMAEFRLNARQVRTALHRLIRDGWLISQAHGRRSYYRLSPSGRRQFARAAERIYAAQPPVWNGEWTLVMPAGIGTAAREELRKRLRWLGFGVFANGVMAHPRTDSAALAETLAELGLVDDVVVWQARPDDDAVLDGLVRDAFHLDQQAAQYHELIANFMPFKRLIDEGGPIDSRDAFVVRSLLVHEYRRIILRTSDLPPALLSDAWPGHDAMRLVGELYALVHDSASRYASARLSNADGPLPLPGPGYFRRFGGLAGQSLRDVTGRRRAVA